MKTVRINLTTRLKYTINPRQSKPNAKGYVAFTFYRNKYSMYLKKKKGFAISNPQHVH